MKDVLTTLVVAVAAAGCALAITAAPPQIDIATGPVTSSCAREPDARDRPAHAFAPGQARESRRGRDLRLLAARG
ncbi:MAG: hypothetical protein ACXWIG_05225 [Caldimonas sp.]